MEPDDIFGALAGWKHEPTASGLKLTLQVAASREAFQTKDYDRVVIAVNERQLRSLARDLTRAAEARGIVLFAKKGRSLKSFFGL